MAEVKYLTWTDENLFRQVVYEGLREDNGGDGQSTFALPTAKPIFTATEATLTQCIALQGVFPSRS